MIVRLCSCFVLLSIIEVAWPPCVRATFKSPFHNFSYDGRRGSNLSFWSEDPPKGFGWRASFVPSRPVSKLFLENVTREEAEGLYRCRVDFLKSQTQNYLMALNVIGKLGRVYREL